MCADDEPEVWRKNYADEIELWIDLGEPDEKAPAQGLRPRRSGGCIAMAGAPAKSGGKACRAKASRFSNLTVISIPPETLQQLTTLTERSMQLQATIQDGQMWLSSGERSVLVEGSTGSSGQA